MSNRFDQLSTDEVRSLTQLFLCMQNMQQQEELGVQLVVVDRGFVYVGKTSVDHEWVYMTNAKCVRKWGTTKGLGELSGGPTKNTLLDEAGNLRIPKRAVISLITCEESSWNSKL